MIPRALILALPLVLTGMLKAEPLSLAGEWRFVLDPGDTGLSADPASWRFPDTIQLPGTTAAQGKGPAFEMELKPDKETMNRLRERHPYVGPAWYQRDIRIPADWQGMDVLLTLERVLWESRVWIDGKPVGKPGQSLCTPHRYDLTSHVQPGKSHTLTLRIDNRRIVDIGEIGHAYTAGTQTIWNGVIGGLTLEALPESRIENLRLATRADGNLTVDASGDFQPGQKLVVRVDGTAIAEAPASAKTTLQGRYAGARPWSELSPNLHKLSLELIDAAGSAIHRLDRSIGFREFKTDGRHLLINGKRTFLRGNLECAIFPLTGHPDAEGTQWEKIMRTSRDYGLNHLRFHSWCPPAAAFAAADRHGIYLQVELPNWTFDMGRKPTVDSFLIAEGQRIFREYAHHPSFVMLSLGNELSGDLDAMDRMVENLRLIAPELLFTSTTFSFTPRGKLPGSADDFFISQQTQSGWVRGQGFLNSNFPSTDTDYDDGMKCLGIPLVTHEVGQYVVYPNLAELPKYEATPLRSTALEVIQRDLREKNLLGDAARFTRDSGKLAALLYKEDIERALRTKDLAGIQLLQLQDFPGQSTATVGLLDAFWDSKGVIDPKEFRRFSSPVAPLARIRKFVWKNTETFSADLELANFSEVPATLGFTAKLNDSKGITVAEQSFPPSAFKLGNGQSIGQFKAPLATFSEPARLELAVESTDGKYRNSWPVWVYPAASAAPEVIIHRGASDACLADLAAAKTVLLLPQGNALRKPVPARFIPVFWSPLHFPNQPGTLGATIDATHPLWGHFPTETHTNWQWWELTANSVAVDLSGFDPAIAKPFRFIDKFDRNALPTAIFETKVGPGKLLVCTLDVTTDPTGRIVARQLQRALRHRAASPDFQPAGSLTPEKFRQLFRESGISASASSAHPEHPAEFAIDGDPATLWHSDWRETALRVPIHLTLDLHQPTAVAGVLVSNRADNRNGRIRELQVEVSSDGKKWAPYGPSATLPDGPEPTTLRFPKAVEVRHLRLVAISSHNDQPLASLAEATLIAADPADVRDLGIIPGFND